MKNKRMLILAFLVPLTMIASAASRAQVPESETDSLYLGNRVMLTTSEPLQLTLNAHIQDFAWSPDGRRIAFFSDSNDDTAIGITRVDGGQQRICFQGHSAPEGSQNTSGSSSVVRLFGWSPDGSKIAFGTGGADSETKQGFRALVIADAATGAINTAPIPTFGDMKGVFDIIGSWSPSQDIFAYIVVGTALTGGQSDHLLLYDAETSESRDLLPFAENANIPHWVDGTHLLTGGTVNGKPRRLLIDVLTGQATLTDLSIHSIVPRSHGTTCQMEAGTAGGVTLSLQKTQAWALPDTYTFAPAVDAQGKPHRPSVHLWVSVLRSVPAPAAKTGKPTATPQILIDSFRHSALDSPSDITADPVAFAPAQGPRPTRAQIAYLISGDLYVSTITSRSASIQELIAAGETLTCPEERQLAQDDARQIALALTEYSQDYNNTLPPAEGFPKNAGPYTENDGLFKIGDKTFRYSLDGDVLTSLDDAKSTEMGDFDLPCGRVVLYADGHVQTLDKANKPLAP